MRHPLLVLLALGSALACNDEADTLGLDRVKKEAQEALSAARSAAGGAKESYVAQLRLRIESLTARIERLERSAKEKGAAASDEVKDQIRALEGKRDALVEKLEALEGKTGDAWEAARDGIEDTLGELEDTYDDVKDQLE